MQTPKSKCLHVRKKAVSPWGQRLKRCDYYRVSSVDALLAGLVLEGATLGETELVSRAGLVQPQLHASRGRPDWLHAVAALGVLQVAVVKFEFKSGTDAARYERFETSL